jgi:Ca-activated chloride channel family protein
MLGRDELCKAPPQVSRRLLLLSDGQLNQGVVDPAMVRQIVADGLEMHHIRTSSIGFGDYYNEDLLAELARVTSGQFYHVDSPEQLPAIFASELDGLQKITAQNVRIRIRAGEFCEAFSQLGENPSVTLPDGRVEFNLGDFTSGEERVVCFAAQVWPMPNTRELPGPHSAGGKIVELEILLDEICETGVVSQYTCQSIRIQATENPTDVQIDNQTMTWVSLQKAARAMREVNRAMDNRRPADAIAVVRDCVNALRAYGPLAAVEEALRAMEGLERMLAEGWNARSRKAARYRSSSYSKMSSAELWSLKNEEAPSFKRDRHDPDSSASSAPAATPPQS